VAVYDSGVLQLSQFSISTIIDRRIWMSAFWSLYSERCYIFFFFPLSYGVLYIHICSVLVRSFRSLFFKSFLIDEQMMRSSVVGKEVLGYMVMFSLRSSIIWTFPCSFLSFLSMHMVLSICIVGSFPIVYSYVGFFHFFKYIYTLSSQERERAQANILSGALAKVINLLLLNESPNNW
jgi:hypothetical protein